MDRIGHFYKVECLEGDCNCNVKVIDKAGNLSSGGGGGGGEGFCNLK